MHSEPSERCKGGSVAPQGHAGGAGAGVIGAVLRAVELRVQSTLWEKHRAPLVKAEVKFPLLCPGRLLILTAFIYCTGGIAQFSTDVSHFISLRLY